MILLEDLGNLQQLHPDIIELFTVKKMTRGGSESPRQPELDGWHPYVERDLATAQKKLAWPLGENSPVKTMPFKTSGLSKVMYDVAILVFIVNGAQIGFISSFSAADDDGTQKVYANQFYATSSLAKVFTQEDLDKAEWWKDHLTAARDEKGRRGKWGRRGSGSNSHYDIDTQKKLKDFATVIHKLAIECEFNSALMTVDKDPNRKHDRADVQRPPAPGERGYTNYAKEAKKDLAERLRKFKASRSTFGSPEEILAAARSGKLYGLEKLRAFNADYELGKLDREAFGALLAGLFGKDKQEEYGSTKPIAPRTEAPGIRYKKFSDDNDPKIAPDEITVWYKIDNGAIVVGKMGFYRNYNDPLYSTQKTWYVGGDVTESRAPKRRSETSHVSRLRNLLNRAGST